MKYAFALVALSVLAFVPANADARLSDCSQMAKQVAAALEQAQPGEATEAARQQATVARNYCSVRMYAKGVARYNEALKLLGKN